MARPARPAPTTNPPSKSLQPSSSPLRWSPCLNKLRCCRVMGSLEKISVLTSRSLLKVYLLHCSRLCDYLMLDCINIRKFKHESECVCIFLSLICLQIHAAKLLLLQEVNNLYSESSRTTPKTFKELSETFLLLHIRCLSVWRQVK